MASEIVFEMENGSKLIFGETAELSGLREVSAAGKVASETAERLEQALGTLGPLIAKLEATVDRLPRRPEKVDIEFGVSLTADCNLWVVSGEGKAEFKVKLGWDGTKKA